MLKFAARVGSLKSSTIMDISAKAAELKAGGLDIVSLAAGEPDFNTPAAIREAATAAMNDGITRYTPAAGFQVLRETIAEMVRKENGIDAKPEEVLITSGAKHALYLAMQTLCDAGDAILIPTPAWVSYTPMIELTGASIIPLPLFEEDGYRPNVDRWKGMAIPSNARGILLNSPNNPTGAVYTKSDLTKVVSWAMQRNLWIMSDEIYEKILYDGTTHTSVAALGPEVKDSTITISGFSKSYAMTGWRLAWAIGEKSLISKMAALQSQSNSHVTSFVQWAGLTAAKLPAQVAQDMVKEFDQRRKYCMGRLDKMSSAVTYSKPEGAFYIFINLSKWLTARKMSDVEFCKELLNRYHVAAVPGSAFGKENCLRLSYANSIKNLEKAFDRMETFLTKG
jgi:aspartate aminotransferase